jgi:transcriptional regulator with XRE-family HTH domain
MLVCEAVRRLRGLSQVQVAERLAVAQTRISHIENGQRVPSTLLQHYAEVVGWVGELDVLQLQWDGSDLSAYLEAPYHLD